MVTPAKFAQQKCYVSKSNSTVKMNHNLKEMLILTFLLLLSTEMLENVAS